MVDFKKLLNRTPEEKARDDVEIERTRQKFLDSVKDDPAVVRMRKLLHDADDSEQPPAGQQGGMRR